MSSDGGVDTNSHTVRDGTCNGAEGRGLHESPQQVFAREECARGAQEHEFHEGEHGDREKAAGRECVQDGGDDAADDKGPETGEAKREGVRVVGVL